MIAVLPSETEQASANTPDILDCFEFRKFWISWSSGIKVGQGLFGHGQFLEWNPDPPMIPVVAVGLSTVGSTPSNSAEWQIQQSIG